MRLLIESNTLATERWFPVFDILLLHLEERRHTFAVEDVKSLLHSSWMQKKSRNDRDLITRSITARSHDRLADKNVVRIDSAVTSGGRVDDEYTTSLHPQDCLTFLAQPFSVIVENEWFDGSFLLWMAKALGREGLITAYRANRLVFRHAGGKGSLERSASVLSTGVWPAPKGRHTRAMKLWSCAVLDNDAKFPGDGPNTEIVRDLAPWVAFVHEFARRSIESYLPYTVLTRYDRSAPFKERVDAIFRLSDEQRRHYPMKVGFRLRDENNPTKATYLASAEVSFREQACFESVADADWVKLASGFGKKMSTIYVEDQFRPTPIDSAAIGELDRAELGRLLDAIYERI